MSKPLRKKHLTPLCTRIDDIASQEVTTRMDLGRIMDMLADQGDRLSRIREELQAKRTLAVDLERVETLLNGVKTALERMGGNVMPSLVGDVHALRDQLTEFRQELAGYRSMLMALSNFADGLTMPVTGPMPKPKRPYNRRKKSNADDQSQVEISGSDAASHNEQLESEP